MKNLLSKKLTHRLKFVNTKTPQLYISPEIHKENNPGRLVIDSINCHSSGILRSVDHHLEPLVRKIPSYIKDPNAGAWWDPFKPSIWRGQVIIIVTSSAIFGTTFLTSSFLFLRMSYRHCRWTIKHARPSFGQQSIHNGK